MIFYTYGQGLIVIGIVLFISFVVISRYLFYNIRWSCFTVIDMKTPVPVK